MSETKTYRIFFDITTNADIEEFKARLNNYLTATCFVDESITTIQSQELPYA